MSNTILLHPPLGPFAEKIRQMVLFEILLYWSSIFPLKLVLWIPWSQFESSWFKLFVYFLRPQQNSVLTMLTALPYRGMMFCQIWECQMGYCQMGTWDKREQLQIRSPTLIHLLTNTLLVFRLKWQSLSDLPKESQKESHRPESYRVPEGAVSLLSK